MKNNNTIILKYLFISIATLELISHVFEWNWIHEFTKPLLMPILLVYFRRGLQGVVNLSFLLATGALIFSWIGDVALMYVYKREFYFLIGLGAFAIAHIFYTFSFSKAVNQARQSMSFAKHISYFLPFVAILVGLMSFLWENLGEMKTSVVLYSTIVICMTVSAVYRHDRTNDKSYQQVMFGVVLFILSSSLLAINKFYAPMANANIWIMATYMLAQWNIINGLQKRFEQSSEVHI